MTNAFDPTLAQRIEECGVIAVLVVDHVEDAIPLARALLAGGVNVIELTLRTPCAMGVLRAITSAFPEMIVGMGTVLTVEQVGEIQRAGAAFGVSPGLNPRVVRAAREVDLSFAPGVLTPSDLELAVELNCRLLKFFPAEPAGGLAYLRAMTAPFEHLNLRFIPLGGLGAKNMASYIADPRVLALGGSWLAPRDLVQNRDWSQITALCEEAMRGVREERAKYGMPVRSSPGGGAGREQSASPAGI